MALARLCTLAIDLSQVREPASEIIHALKQFHVRANGGLQA